jgi:hypothetical protein
MEFSERTACETCISAAEMSEITFWRELMGAAKVARRQRRSFDQMETLTLNRITCAGSVTEDPITLRT